MCVCVCVYEFQCIDFPRVTGLELTGREREASVCGLPYVIELFGGLYITLNCQNATMQWHQNMAISLQYVSNSTLLSTVGQATCKVKGKHRTLALSMGAMGIAMTNKTNIFLFYTFEFHKTCATSTFTFRCLEELI